MTFALIYRALERNTGSVGLESVPCTSIQAVNPEIAALQQHQDPAADGAAALNKQIAQELAAQIAAIGGDPTLANEASTFAPGEIGDPTAKGNTCDDDADDNGCINTLGLRVDDLSEAEALAAAQGGAGAGAGNGAAGNGTANAGNGNANNAADNLACNLQGSGNAGNANNNNNGNANNNAANDNNSGNANTGNNANNNANTGNNANNNANNNASNGAANGSASTAAFGTCADPTITFSQAPSDGRQEAAFEATDLTNFPHGSALGIGVISSFICDQLVNKCKADQAAVDKCDQADAAVKASGLKGQAAADSFNQALGF